MNETDTKWTAAREMAERINTLRARVAGYDREEVERAERRLTDARAALAEDERLLAEWQDIANRSA